jgi:hypothetical protein
MSDENNKQISEEHAKAIDHAIGEIDLSKVSIHDVFIDFVNRAKRFNFEIMCAMRLIEKILVAHAPANESEEQPKAE